VKTILALCTQLTRRQKNSLMGHLSRYRFR
jgi:hypothetical protein